MPLDAICLTALTKELSQQITGNKIDKIHQPEQDQIILALRGQGVNTRLLISAGTGDARLHITQALFENPPNPPMFCMLLRKHLTGAKIKSIDQPPLERAVDITLECQDLLGEPCEKHLMIELMGRYSNIILTAHDGMIIDCLRRVDTIMSELRQVLPGLYYRLPPVQNKQDPLTITPDEFVTLFGSARSDIGTDKWLLETFNGFSPLICREIVHRSYGDASLRVDDIRANDGGRALLGAFSCMMEGICAGRFDACLLFNSEEKPVDFSYTMVRQYGGALRTERMQSFSELLDAYYAKRAAAERMRQRSQALTKKIKNAHDRVARKLENQREELKKTFGRDRLRELGDIITANIHAVKKGMTLLNATDYYSKDGREVAIRLDPMKTPQQNAAKYYKDYTKAKTAESALKEQITLGEAELAYLKSVLDEIVRAESERDLNDIRQELVQTGYIKAQKTGKKERAVVTSLLRFESSGGYLIHVGRNNVQNEALTHKTAFKTDIWLHAQKIPGSHVIISAKGQAPDVATLEEAAALAAFYSQARESKKVPVDYTIVKNVKKIPGGRPGMVTYTDYKTIIAQPQENITTKLKEK